MRQGYLDRKGNPISVMEWVELFGDYNYKLVKKTILNGYTISTIWLGMDHSFCLEEDFLIFETMIFPLESFEEVYMERYSTEREALIGHEKAVEYAKTLEPIESKCDEM